MPALPTTVSIAMLSRVTDTRNDLDRALITMHWLLPTLPIQDVQSVLDDTLRDLQALPLNRAALHTIGARLLAVTRMPQRINPDDTAEAMAIAGELVAQAHRAQRDTLPSNALGAWGDRLAFEADRVQLILRLAALSAHMAPYA